MLKDFKAFILRGNVLELAVAVVVGSAFSAIVNSLVGDIITPLILDPVMHIAGVSNIEGLSWHAVKYGVFISSVLKFLVIAWVLFLIVRAANAMSKKKADAPAPPSGPTQEQLLAEIRDLLKK